MPIVSQMRMGSGYYCPKCGKFHLKYSKIGQKHALKLFYFNDEAGRVALYAKDKEEADELYMQGQGDFV